MNTNERENTMSINHGTSGGDDAHRRRGETPCQACSEARAAYNRAYIERRAAEAGMTARQFVAQQNQIAMTRREQNAEAAERFGVTA